MALKVKAKWQRSSCLCIAHPSPCCAVLMADIGMLSGLLLMTSELQMAGAPPAMPRPHLKKLVED